MKYMLVEKLHDSAFGSAVPAPGRHRPINSRIEIRSRAAHERAVWIE